MLGVHYSTRASLAVIIGSFRISLDSCRYKYFHGYFYIPVKINCLYGIVIMKIKTVFYGVSIICIAYAVTRVLFYFGIFTSAYDYQQRVPNARKNVEKQLHETNENAKINYPPKGLLIRAFKHEEGLEIWASNEIDGEYILLKTYPIAKQSGVLDPKRKEGDKQVPEGFYYIDRFNPRSRYHLSLGLNYPNESDKVRSDKKQPGSDIFIHGSNVSIGCLAVTDEIIEEIYILALDVKQGGLKNIPVHLFPFRMNVSMWENMF